MSRMPRATGRSRGRSRWWPSTCSGPRRQRWTRCTSPTRPATRRTRSSSARSTAPGRRRSPSITWPCACSVARVWSAVRTASGTTWARPGSGWSGSGGRRTRSAGLSSRGRWTDVSRGRSASAAGRRRHPPAVPGRGAQPRRRRTRRAGGPARGAGEPTLTCRSAGARGPSLAFELNDSTGSLWTWEVLLQHGFGQQPQLRLVLSGDRRTTPRLHALRVYYPRFSYVEHYLPAVYQRDADSASFLTRYLANVEGTLSGIEANIRRCRVVGHDRAGIRIGRTLRCRRRGQRHRRDGTRLDADHRYS